MQFRILTSSRENAVDGGLYHAGHRAKFIDGDVSVVAVFKNTRGDRAKYQIVVETGDESRFVVKLLYAPKMSKKSQKRQKILEKFLNDAEKSDN